MRIIPNKYYIRISDTNISSSWFVPDNILRDKVLNQKFKLVSISRYRSPTLYRVTKISNMAVWIRHKQKLDSTSSFICKKPNLLFEDGWYRSKIAFGYLAFSNEMA